MFDSAMRSYITKLLPEGEQGSLQGTLSALTLLCNVAAGFVSNHLFDYLISSSSPVYWPGEQLLFAALLFGAAARSTRRALEGAPSQRGLPVRNATGCPAFSVADSHVLFPAGGYVDADDQSAKVRDRRGESDARAREYRGC